MKLSELYTNFQLLSIDFFGFRSAKTHEKTRVRGAGFCVSFDCVEKDALAFFARALPREVGGH